MTPELALYIIMVESGMVINDGTMYSLRKAIEEGNVYFFDDDGIPTGFCTWRFKDDDLIVENMCMFSKKGITNLFKIRDFIKKKYPNILKVRWHSDTRGKDVYLGFPKNEQHNRSISVAEDSGS